MRKSPEIVDVSTETLDRALPEFGFESDAWMDFVRHASAPAALGAVDGYELLEIAGAGGQGTVYRARRIDDGAVVALKRIHGGVSASRAARRQLLNELSAAASLLHDAIVPARPVEIADELMIEMDWVDGVPLSEWARGVENGTPRSNDELLGIFVAICDALEHAHSNGVIHRDLKPSNILVDRIGTPHLLDFGVAGFLAEAGPLATTQITVTHQLACTPAYASPEQVAGAHGAVDARSDVYSLGVMLYEAFTGASPYPAKLSLGRLLVAVQDYEPKRPRSIRSTIPHSVEAVILNALHKDPTRRYESVERLRADLEHCRRGETPTARYSHVRTCVRRSRKRFPILFWIVPILMSLAVGMIGISAYNVWLDRSGRAFVDTVVPEILADWNAELLLSHAESEAMADMQQAVSHGIWDRFQSMFGPMHSYLGSEGDADWNPMRLGNPAGIWRAFVRCEKDLCVIEIRLRRHSSRWWIDGFVVSRGEFDGVIGPASNPTPVSSN